MKKHGPHAIRREKVDVVILGAGLAGLTLARQLLLRSEKRILMLDKRLDLPGPKQKVGESTVQVGGYYFSKVLDLEEPLFREHLMKYNLRFYWKARGRSGEDFDEYAQTYLRNFSNLACFQIDRNVFEADLLRRNEQFPSHTREAGVSDLEVELGGSRDHLVRYTVRGERFEVATSWVVDTTGRSAELARSRDLRLPDPIRHAASFCWVDGLVDIERLPRASPDEVRLRATRRHTGHLPQWLATNHFMGKGFWFWVIPLQGKTSLGLVFDRRRIDPEEVRGAERLLAWVERQFPFFGGLSQRKVLDSGWLRSYSHGCRQTLDPSGWAMSGESGRFTDPLYSPGSDMIALHNTFLTAVILQDDAEEIARRCAHYEPLMSALNDALVPGYADGYDALGDQESFSLKYTWELSVYFTFYVFPFINDLFVDPRFGPTFLRRFARLGGLNARLQAYLSAYHAYKEDEGLVPAERVMYELSALAPLRAAQDLFFEVGVTHGEALTLLDEQLKRLEELALFIASWVGARTAGDPDLIHDQAFVESIPLEELAFDPAALRTAAARRGTRGVHTWRLEADAFRVFESRRSVEAVR